MLMRQIFKFAKNLLPPISRTEKIALESGTTGLDRLIFSGQLKQSDLEKYSKYKLTGNDVKMLNKVHGLLNTIDELKIIRKGFMEADDPFWKKAKEDKFLAMNFEEKYGGVPVSATGMSRILQKISSASAVGSVHVMVPNSLGPGELLLHYGTERQKEEYLPRLAAGAIPCFGLTSPEAGSDAAGSMTDKGLVYKDESGEIKIRISCNKRYITLAPVADIIGLAFKLEDPDNLLYDLRKGLVDGDKTLLSNVDGEITLALVERDTVGMKIGPRHDPLGVGFANGTISGSFDISIDQVIGEEGGLGQGWKMLMECLSAGRGVSLPATAVYFIKKKLVTD